MAIFIREDERFPPTCRENWRCTGNRRGTAGASPFVPYCAPLLTKPLKTQSDRDADRDVGSRLSLCCPTQRCKDGESRSRVPFPSRGHGSGRLSAADSSLTRAGSGRELPLECSTERVAAALGPAPSVTAVLAHPWPWHIPGPGTSLALAHLWPWQAALAVTTALGSPPQSAAAL